MLIPKVLLVNDDAASLMALESVLMSGPGEPDFELLTASSGSEALREVLKHEFAVILLDVNMPGMDGFETAEAIHSHPRSASVPIIFITAHYDDELHRIEAYRKGAADYLFTPVIPSVLLTKVAVFVDLTRKNLELQAKTEELSRLNQDLRVQRLQDLERINQELEAEVAERKVAEERANALSIRDPLTGLVNRRSLIAQLEHAVASVDRNGSEFALLFLDLDKFKHINDTLGHEVGDELLRQVAARLLASVRVSDVVARLGGDEFVVLLEGAGAGANAARVARKIALAHSKPFEIKHHRVHTSTSVGIGLYPQDARDAAQLMKNADTAMYHAKQNRRGSIEFFREELNTRERERARWIAELQQALAGDELELLFQPRASLPERALSGIEALLYWRHPQHGMIAATEFLAGLNDHALLEQVTQWSIGAACTQAAEWRRAAPSLPQLTMSVDLPVLRLSTELADNVLGHLRKCKLPHGWLELDICEHLLIGNSDAAPVLRQLKAAGIKLAVDDFGSAGASLATLRALAMDMLKIDRAFVHDLDTDSGADMAAAIIHLGRALGMRVLAKGVERDDQLTVLNSLGCDQYQGDLFSPPLQAGAMLAMLQAQYTDSITSQAQNKPAHHANQNDRGPRR
ncbi:bifunctional diguanylate cyclase/phosphodiesterase [Massilia sp. CF038]|uniref:putative bifunctional diguanylate cyclase/phosphodiesterase n=1 Tax=Massilia sp. CF038 TaxID=1881045 RepID=UPI0009143421|nr:EAL domain-containing protein [Massilia sp. CF038]SHG67636.1 diguanylate cyclase (GGDEF) domain-containing protein [Massilia sp. CF038]